MDNAYTAQDHTNYFFEVSADVFRQAMDRFAHFFIDPLLTADGVSREVNAVNSEHTKNLNSDIWREEQMVLNLAQVGSKLHHFGTGSLETLVKPTLHAEVVRFYNLHYTSAKNMKLCVLGPQSLDELQGWVEAIFSQVPNVAPINVTHPQYLPAFPTGSLPIRVHIQPMSTTVRTVVVFFHLDYDVGMQYRQQVSSYIEYIHGSKHDESLYHCLREKGWLDSFAFEYYDNTPFMSLFKVSFMLTELGQSQYETVLRTYYDYLDVLKDATNTKACTIWDDYVRVQKVGFRFQEKSTAADYTSRLAMNMQVLDATDLLGSPSSWSCRAETLRSTLGYISQNTAIEMVWFGNVDNTTLPLAEPIYGTRYNRSQPNAAKPPSTEKTCPNLGSRPANSNIPQNFAILPSNYNITAGPTIQKNEPGLSVWSKPSQYFPMEPKVDFRCKIRSASLPRQANQSVMAKLYEWVVNDQLEEATSDARAVGMSYSFSLLEGINVRVEGYNDGASALLSSITDLIPLNTLRGRVTPARFNIILSQYKQGLDDLKHLPLYQLTAKYWRPLVFNAVSVSAEEQLTILSTVTMDDMWSTLEPNLFQRTHVSCLGLGNVAPDAVVQMANRVATATSKSPATEKELPTTGMLVLRNGDDILLHGRPFLADEVNEVIMLRYEWDGGSYPAAAILEKLISNRCFDELRTKQQLGYVVWCWVMRDELPTRTAVSFFLLVQSGVFNATVLLQRAETFLVDTFASELTKLDVTTFKMAVNGVVTALQEPPLTLPVETDNVWTEIVSGKLLFDRSAKTIDAVRAVSLIQVQALYNAYIVNPTTRRRTSVVVGNTPVIGYTSQTVIIDVKDIGNLSSWKAKQNYVT
jgi:insulysin